MVQPATIADISAVARREALNAGRKIIGVTVSQPAYVSFPDDQAPGAVLEFVVDVSLSSGVTQAISTPGGGIQVVAGVLVASDAVGNLISQIGTPVEIEKSVSGQLTVVGRAKVTLPDTRVDEYSFSDLGIEFVSGYTLSGGELVDPFGDPAIDAPGLSRGIRFRSEAAQVFRESTIEEWSQDLNGNEIGIGNSLPIVRTVQEVTSTLIAELDETVRLGEATEES